MKRYICKILKPINITIYNTTSLFLRIHNLRIMTWVRHITKRTMIIYIITFAWSHVCITKRVTLICIMNVFLKTDTKIIMPLCLLLIVRTVWFFLCSLATVSKYQNQTLSFSKYQIAHKKQQRAYSL